MTFYGATRKEAADQLRVFQRKHDPDKAQKFYSALTVDEYLIYWLTGVRKSKLKPSSYDRVESTINNHIIPRIGQYKISGLTSEHVNEMLQDMQKPYTPANRKSEKNIDEQTDKGQKLLSFSSIKKAYNIIDAALRYAENNDYIGSNPCRRVELVAANNFETKEIIFFNDDEIKRFKEVCISRYGNDKPKYVMGHGMIFILNTGIRIGEALPLKWSDIDFENNVLKIDKNLVKIKDRKDSPKKKYIEVVQNSTKTKSGARTIPLNKTAIQSLLQLKKIRHFGEDSCIFSTSENTMYDFGCFRRMFTAIVKKAGIQHCGIHSLRHTFATQLFKHGVDIKTVSSLLGHASIQITYNTYIHVIEEQKAKAVQIIDDI